MDETFKIFIEDIVSDLLENDVELRKYIDQLHEAVTDLKSTDSAKIGYAEHAIEQAKTENNWYKQHLKELFSEYFVEKVYPHIRYYILDIL